MRRSVLRGPGPAARRWRRRRTRGVSDLVATILLVAITVVLAAVLYILIQSYTHGPATIPGLSTALALGTPQEAVSRDAAIAACATVCNFYNMSVKDAGHNLALHDLIFEVIGQNGTNLVPTGGVVAVNATGQVVAQYGFKTGWTAGSSLLVDQDLTIILYTSGAPPLGLSGDTLRVVGTAAYSGSIDVQIT